MLYIGVKYQSIKAARHDSIEQRFGGERSKINIMTLAQMKKDVTYIFEEYNYPEDLCGDVCNTELFWRLLMGEISKEDCFESIMQRYYEKGTDDGEIPEEDKRAQRIFKRWKSCGLIQ